jgi:hypothetical protein
VPFRPKQDPRELKILDPACGSGHFLLYAFDLLATIYEEAWLDPELGPSLWRDAGFAPNTDAAPDEALRRAAGDEAMGRLRRALPRLDPGAQPLRHRHRPPRGPDRRPRPLDAPSASTTPSACSPPSARSSPRPTWSPPSPCPVRRRCWRTSSGTSSLGSSAR